MTCLLVRVRELHRRVAPLVVLPLLITVCSGSATDWPVMVGASLDQVHWLMALHEGNGSAQRWAGGVLLAPSAWLDAGDRAGCWSDGAGRYTDCLAIQRELDGGRSGDTTVADEENTSAEEHRGAGGGQCGTNPQMSRRS